MIKLEKVPDVQNDEELIKVKTLVTYISIKPFATFTMIVLNKVLILRKFA